MLTNSFRNKNKREGKSTNVNIKKQAEKPRCFMSKGKTGQGQGFGGCLTEKEKKTHVV
jgi:hypothetical protein